MAQQHTCTLVTCFYPIKSKFPSTQYLVWARTYMQLDAPIVLFTTPELVDTFRSMRDAAKPLHVVSLPFEELDMWVAHKDAWIAHHALDPEARIHTPELYTVWAQKPVFVERAIALNPFNTQHFFWCDIGAFRGELNATIRASFPSTRYLPHDRILLSAVNECTATDWVTEDFSRSNRIVGGLWGGGIAGCRAWSAAFQRTLRRYFAEGKFAGKDQSVMLSTYMSDTTLATVVRPTIPFDPTHVWFFLTQLCSDLSMDYALEPSYIGGFKQPIVSAHLMGGLGNQMFQIAMAYVYASHNHGALRLLRTKVEPDGRDMYWDSTLIRFRPYLVNTLPSLRLVYDPANHTYVKLPDLDATGIYFNGYWQTPKYFESHRAELRALFSPPQTTVSELRKKYKELLDIKDRVIVVHARRTDYLKSEHNIRYHGPLDVDYYKRAIQHIATHVKNPVFLLSSDDNMFWLDAIPSIPALQTSPFYILADEDDVRTLALLQQFRQFVIANSTFSWWAAWLADAKIVCAPAKWYGPDGPSRYEDLYDSSWVKL
jgi:hypothetical protein